MKRINIKQIEYPLILISFAFLALWLLGAFYVLLSPLEAVSLLSFKEAQPIYIFLMYTFSLIIPTIGLLIFMKDNMKKSSRWYFGIPFLVSIFLMTLLRDEKYMSMFFEISYISTYDVSEFLSSKTGQALINIFFSSASVSFILSVPKNKKEIMKIPLIVSIITAASIIIFYLAYLPFNTTIDSLYYLGILCSFLLGIALLRVAVNYKIDKL